MRNTLKMAAILGFTVILAACSSDDDDDIEFDPTPITIDAPSGKF